MNTGYGNGKVKSTQKPTILITTKTSKTRTSKSNSSGIQTPDMTNTNSSKRIGL